MARPAAFRFIRTASWWAHWALPVTESPGRFGFRAENPFIFIAGYDKDEDIALAGQHGYAPSSSILATNVFINGIRLPYVNSSTIFSNTTVPRGNADSHYPIQAAPTPYAYPVATLGGVSGQIRQPIQSDPLPGTINGQPRLTAGRGDEHP